MVRAAGRRSRSQSNPIPAGRERVGAAMGSRPELAGQATRVRRLGTIAALGGGAGAALLLITPAQTFVRLAPVLIGAASLALLAPSRQHRAARRGAGPDRDELSRG